MTKGPETRLQMQMQKAIRERGGFVFKVHGSETMMSGLPDLVVCYRGYFIGFEVKTPSPDSKVSVKQRSVMRKIMRAQGVVTVPRSVSDVLNALDRIDRIIGNDQGVVEDLSVGFGNDRVWRR